MEGSGKEKTRSKRKRKDRNTTRRNQSECRAEFLRKGKQRRTTLPGTSGISKRRVLLENRPERRSCEKSKRDCITIDRGTQDVVVLKNSVVAPAPSKEEKGRETGKEGRTLKKGHSS